MRLVLFVFLCLFVVDVSAQADTPPITPNNVTTLTETATFPCEGATNQAASAFYGDTFAYACYANQGSRRAQPIITAVSLSSGAILWTYEPPVYYMPRFYLLDVDMLLIDAQSRVEIYRIGEDEPMFVFVMEIANLTTVEVSPDRQYFSLVTGEYEAWDILVYRVADAIPVNPIFTLPGALLPLNALSAVGTLATTDGRGIVTVYDVETGEVVVTTVPGEQRVQIDPEHGESWVSESSHYYDDMIFSPDGRRLLTTECTFVQMGCWEQGITLFSVDTGDIVAVTANEFEIFNFIGFTDDDHLLAMGSCGQKMQLLTLDTLVVTPLFELNPSSCDRHIISVSDEGRYLAHYDYGEDVSFYRVYGVGR